MLFFLQPEAVKDVLGRLGGLGDVYKGRPPPPAQSHRAFMVPLSDLEATHDRLAEQGIAFDPIVENTSGDLIAYFRDPAENTAQLIGRKDPLGH